MNLPVVKALFGDPSAYLDTEGRATAAWEAKILLPVTLPRMLPLAWDMKTMVGTIRCHRKVAGAVSAAFREIAAAGNWGKLTSYGGCYNWRLQRGSPTLSMHAWGIALDFNVAENPFGCTLCQLPEEVILAFAHNGFQYGGDFHAPRRDAMHLEARIDLPWGDVAFRDPQGGGFDAS